MIPKLICGLLLSGLSMSMAHGEVIIEKSKDKTSGDVPLNFVLQKADWKYDGYAIWGKVVNDVDDKTYENVGIIFTAYDAEGKFLGRAQGSVGPTTIGEGEVGYVNATSIDTSHFLPAKIEWKVISGRY